MTFIPSLFLNRVTCYCVGYCVGYVQLGLRYSSFYSRSEHSLYLYTNLIPMKIKIIVFDSI